MHFALITGKINPEILITVIESVGNSMMVTRIGDIDLPPLLKAAGHITLSLCFK